jgi:hypothetical protein
VMLNNPPVNPERHACCGTGPNDLDKDELDVKALQGDKEKIKTLMRRDPRFISRLITV